LTNWTKENGYTRWLGCTGTPTRKAAAIEVGW
jgi:hypothetical protein